MMPEVIQSDDLFGHTRKDFVGFRGATNGGARRSAIGSIWSSVF